MVASFHHGDLALTPVQREAQVSGDMVAPLSAHAVCRLFPAAFACSSCSYAARMSTILTMAGAGSDFELVLTIVCVSDELCAISPSVNGGVWAGRNMGIARLHGRARERSPYRQTSSM